MNSRVIIYIVIASILSFFLVSIENVKTYKEPQEVYRVYLKGKSLGLIKAKEIENKYKDLEAPITERVFVYKDSYEVPRERQMVCPNCGRIIDKNATICIKCGYLLKSVIQEKVVEKVVSKEDNLLRDLYKEEPKHNNKFIINTLINVGLVVGIIICIVLIINMAIERGIIG